MAIDGSENIDIHCIKDGGVASEARAEISRATSILLSPQEDTVDPGDDPDPFKDIKEDENELEENEVIIEDDEDEENDQE